MEFVINTEKKMNETIQCPLCDGTGIRHDHKCPECCGTGRVENVFALAGRPTIETDEETAAAECRPIEDVMADTAAAKKWIRENVPR